MVRGGVACELRLQAAGAGFVRATVVRRGRPRRGLCVMDGFLVEARRRGSCQAKALLGFVAAAAVCAAVFPANALADFTASLSLDQSGGTTAGSTPAIGFDEKFGSTSGDGVKTVTVVLPPGMLQNESIAGGSCLLSSSPKSCLSGRQRDDRSGGRRFPVVHCRPRQATEPGRRRRVDRCGRDHAADHLGRDARSHRCCHGRLDPVWVHR